MKKIVAFLVVIFIMTLAGCGNRTNIDTPMATSTVANTDSQGVSDSEIVQDKITIRDYDVSGMMNVQRISYVAVSGASAHEVTPKSDEANALWVYVLCPYCQTEASKCVKFSDVPESDLGKASFTYEGYISCDNWSDHQDEFTSDYNYSILFTLDK